MKIYRLCYNSYGDEVCGGDEYLFISREYAEKHKKKMIENSMFEEENFSIEELEVREEHSETKESYYSKHDSELTRQEVKELEESSKY